MKIGCDRRCWPDRRDRSALALRKAGFTGEIVGVSSPRTIAEALSHRIIDREMTLGGGGGFGRCCFLAQPIGRIVSMIEEMEPLLGPSTLVTDAGSTKALICAAAARFCPRAVFGRASDGGERIARGFERRWRIVSRTDVGVDAREFASVCRLGAKDWLARFGDGAGRA